MTLANGDRLFNPPNDVRFTFTLGESHHITSAQLQNARSTQTAPFGSSNMGRLRVLILPIAFESGDVDCAKMLSGPHALLAFRATADTCLTGPTIAHEIGHWLSLHHTFLDGCDTENDLVDDTPAHTRASETVPGQCNEAEQCPGAGPPPYQSIMSYGSCAHELTDGQRERI